MHARRSQRGLSLVEVMVAVGIVSLMGAMVAMAFNTTFTARDVVEGEAEKYRMIRTAFSRMTREIGSAFVSDRYDSARYRDQNDRPTNFIGQNERLTFSSFSHQRLHQDAKESDQVVIEYRVQASTEPQAKGRQDLVRRANPLVQDRMDRGGTEDVLLEDVKRIEFEYWDSEREEWEREWDTRRVERKSILPTRVRITVTALDENGKEAKYFTQVRVMLNTELDRYN